MLNSRIFKSEIENEKRIVFLDVARGIGIVCVLLGHNLWRESRGTAIIFNFHMPLFYFISGIFCVSDKYRTWQSIYRKVMEMLVPFPFFCILSCIVFWSSPELLKQLSKRMLFALFVHGEPWYNKPLWFIVSLAMVFLVFSFVSPFLEKQKPYRKLWFLIFCSMLAFAVTNLPINIRSIFMPVMLTTVPFGLFWFGLGNFLAIFVKKLGKMDINVVGLFIITGILLVMISIGTDFSTKPDIRTARMGSWLLFPRSLCGIIAVILLARALCQISVVNMRGGY